ncbi:phosphoenolpyruvate-protein phosphotransferase [Ectothiorhodospiraceae bacterium WFHF3C12]|nr:phosphoenolpyruvate-protein phosphotransferase [Ectothiorhodospiraceae bacterium WFHF3C12]
MTAIYATPFRQGIAEGELQRLEQGAPTALVILDYNQLQDFQGPAAGLIVVGAAPLSHPMLRLSMLNVPTVIVTPHQARGLTAGSEYVMDGTHGIIADRETWRRSDGRALVPDPPRPAEPVMTRDGVGLELRASVTGPEGARQAHAFGAASIGMVRSEYMMPADGGRPDVDFFREAFEALCEAADGLPVTLRLLDLAPDKVPDWLPDIEGMRGLLGLRGSRLYGAEPVRSVFLAQARAAGEVSRRYPLRVMLPYLVQPEEYRRWRADIAAVAPDTLAVGVMAETPAAALAIDEWLQLADFVSIGCNDLMQCMFGADREIPELAGLLDPYSPVLFRFLRQVATLSDDRLASVQLCGLLSRVPRIFPALLGLGFRNFTLEPHLIPLLAETVRGTDMDTARALADAVCAQTEADAVRTMLGLRGSGAWRETEPH